MHQEKSKGGRTRMLYDTESGARELLVQSILPTDLMASR